MTTEITATEAARNLADYLNRVAYKGERFLITRGKKPVAELRPPIEGMTGKDLAKIFADLPALGAEEAESFAADIQAGIDWANAQPVNDPWES